MSDGPIHRRGRHAGSLLARLDEPRSETRTRIAVVADPHVSVREAGTSKLFEHTRDHLANAVADVAERDVDLVFSVGDLTKDGERWNYDAVDDVLADLDVPFLAIPGNHDVPKERDEHDCLSVPEFEERYCPDSLPYVERVGGVDLVGINTAGSESFLHDSHDGFVRESTQEWLADTLPTLDTPVVAAHHNLRPMSEQLRAHRAAVEPDMHVPPETRNADEFGDVLAAAGVPLLLTGHLHMPSAAVYEGVRELMMPTTCSFPQAYVLLDVGPAGTEARMVPVTDHDGMTMGHDERWRDSVTARGLTAMAAVRCAQFPLVDDR